MAVQSTYSETMSAGRAGMIANEEPAIMISRTIVDETGVAFGKVVQEASDDGSTDGQCTADLATVALSATSFLGVTVRERNVNPATPNSFGNGEEVRIMRRGVIWVEVEAAVVAGTQPTVDTATGVIGSGAGTEIPNARWDSSTSGAGLAKLRLG